jgi:putative ABC transport system permease protein
VPASDRAEAKQALRDGKSVVLNGAFVQADDMIWVWHEAQSGEWSDRPRHKLAAQVLDLTGGYGSLPPVVVSPETAERLGWQARPYGLLLDLKETATQREFDLAAGNLAGANLELYVERGYQPDNQQFLLIVAGFGAFVTLVGVAVSVALSASEGRADLATLAAVGAQPRRRRALAAAQALLVGGLGCLLGILLGAFLAVAAQAAVGAPEFTVPWTSVLITAIVIPLFAALCAALFTRSTLPMVRRAE